MKPTTDQVIAFEEGRLYASSKNIFLEAIRNLDDKDSRVSKTFRNIVEGSYRDIQRLAQKYSVNDTDLINYKNLYEAITKK